MLDVVRTTPGGGSFPNYTQSTTPSTPTSGEFWWDTNIHVLKRYDGTAWQWVGLDALANVDTTGKADGYGIAWDTDVDPDAWVPASIGGGGGGGTLQWADWTPVVKNGTTTVGYDAATSKAKYLSIGPVTLFWFILKINAAGVGGAIVIQGQPAALQDAHPENQYRHIGSCEFQDSGTAHTLQRLFAQGASSWNLYRYDQFAATTTALANGDALKGYGFVHTSDSAVAI